jgi:hypothetical protein
MWCTLGGISAEGHATLAHGFKTVALGFKTLSLFGTVCSVTTKNARLPSHSVSKISAVSPIISKHY